MCNIRVDLKVQSYTVSRSCICLLPITQVSVLRHLFSLDAIGSVKGLSHLQKKASELGGGFTVWGWKAETLHGKSFRIREYTGIGLCRQSCHCMSSSKPKPLSLAVLKIYICKYFYFSHFRHFMFQTCRAVKRSEGLRGKKKCISYYPSPFRRIFHHLHFYSSRYTKSFLAFI